MVWVRRVMTNMHSVFSWHENKYNTDVQMDVKSTFVCKCACSRTYAHAHSVFEEHQMTQV